MRRKTQDGKTEHETIESSVQEMLSRMRLGMFDGVIDMG